MLVATSVPEPLRPARPSIVSIREAIGVPPAGQLPVDVIACGRHGRRDEAAPLEIAAAIERRLPARARLLRVAQVGVDDLLAVRVGGSLVVIDTMAGLRPGQFVVGRLADLGITTSGPMPRGARSLTMPGLLGLVDMIRGRPLPAVLVGIGGLRFGPGPDLTPRVARGLPAIVEAVLQAVDDA